MKVLPAIYWDVYAFFYERMKDFPAYQIMLEKVYDSLAIRENGIYLDAGCGTGEFLKMLGGKCRKAYGIDISGFMLKMAIKKINDPRKILIFQGDVIRNLPFHEEFFDGIACIHVINYLENPHPLLKEFYKILKTGGKLSLVSIKKLNPLSFLEYYRQFLRKNKLKAIESLLSYIIVGILNAPMKLKFKVHHYDEETLRKLLEKAGFSSIQCSSVYAAQSILATCEKRA